jgi:antitoxin ParD1/3/4
LYDPSNKIDFGALLVLIHINSNYIHMTRQSISFTEPNDEWLKSLITKQESARKSEIINDLIRQARNQQSQIDWIGPKLEKAEKKRFYIGF